MLRLLSWLQPLLVLSMFFVPALSQRPPSMQFQWKFANDGLNGNLPTCVPLGIIVQSWDINKNDTIGIAPYYMLSFEVDGTPQTQFIGTNNRTLEWEVRHPPGTKLLLGVVDSTQSSGGIPKRLFNVIAGANTDCVINSSPSSDFTVTTNVTDTLETCQPWGITIKGGIQPYNVTLPALDSPFTTNTTILSGFDHFTYINRANPGTQLIAAVSDSTGRWAYGTPRIATRGKSDTKCPGLDSGVGIASVIEQENAERARQQQSKSNTAIIAGVTVPLVVLLLGGAGFAFWFFRRRKMRAHESEKMEMGSEVIPFDPHGTGGQSDYHTTNSSTITPFDASTTSSHPPPQPRPTASAKHMEAMGIHSVAQSSSAGGLSYTTPSGTSGFSNSTNNWNSPVNVIGGPVSTSDDYTIAGSDTSSNAGPARRPTRPNFAAFPTRSTRSLSGKAAEAAADADAAAAMSPDSEYANAADEIVIQHRDGGVPVIRELPPPYMDPSTSGSRQ